ncbi:phosphoribosyltransferase family protein [Mastigocoleus sp. MO_188.B34]|uniref:phosphoribosyltransferase n=1 Tax=Mastigocoleus sp. MO_188.B34 TaxID=3036635 RepID=UPI00262537E0|nr:phosphoribosyltransferase family protein [Mastigocoleus sp. MO_188.B34]MDJ0697643.1 phosphoribosyltransferase family protein [Mastigocoleus sp. MO_188.B34]
MSDAPLFANRADAGKKLALAVDGLLTQQTNILGETPRAIVYALPRGGVPVGVEISQYIGCPLTIIISKKIGHPENQELAIGAVTATGSTLWVPSYKCVNYPQWQKEALDLALKQAKLLEKQLISFCPDVEPKNATLILVDDGIATGMTVAVAIKALRTLSPREIWVCAPVAPMRLLPYLREWCDRSIILATPQSFFSVSNFYVDFPQVETSTVRKYLQQQY